MTVPGNLVLVKLYIKICCVAQYALFRGSFLDVVEHKKFVAMAFNISFITCNICPKGLRAKGAEDWTKSRRYWTPENCLRDENIIIEKRTSGL